MITTERLILREWRLSDRDPFIAMNADPRVMEHFPSTLSAAETDASIGRITAHLAEHGFGFWAVEIPGRTPFAGFIGLARVRFATPFTPAVEIGWRLACDCWGAGYATEGARAALDVGFTALHLPEIVSFTVPGNARSQAVMRKIGLRHDPDGDFDHPLLPAGHPLQRHVLYRLRRADYRRARPQ